MELGSSSTGSVERSAKEREFPDFLLDLKNTVQQELIKQKMKNKGFSLAEQSLKESEKEREKRNEWIIENWVKPGYSPAFERFFAHYSQNPERRKVLKQEFEEALKVTKNPKEASKKVVKELLPYFLEFFVVNDLSLDPKNEEGIVLARGARTKDDLPPVPKYPPDAPDILEDPQDVGSFPILH